MKSYFSQGIYEIMHKDKYVGGNLPKYRSGWELAFMRMCDEHPNVLKWASENIKIPYRHPFTGKYRNYVPDFMIQYIDQNNKMHVELIEIKPSDQTTMENATTVRQKEQVAINAEKWRAAHEWCKRKGIRFKVINENQIFNNQKRRK